MNATRSERKLRILHIILVLRPTNGQYNEHCLPMLGLRDITICTYFKSQITPPGEIKLFNGDGTLVGFFRALHAALKEDEYDVIHVHTPHAGALLMIYLLATGRYGELKPTTVHTIQNSYQNFKLRNRLLHLPSFPLFERLVFCSQASYESFPTFFKWMGGNRMSVVQNAVDLTRINRVAQAVEPSHKSSFIVTTVGLIKMKNPFTVLNAFRQSRDETSKLVYLGEGNLRSLLNREIEKASLGGQVELTGMVERDRVFQYFAQSDLFVSASWGEGLPVAVLEAMACRSPVVLSDIPPHREIAEGAEFIPLIEPGDVAGFAREISRFLEMPASERRGIGLQCQELIEKRFSLPAMHAGYAEIYSQVTGNPVLALAD